MEYNICKWPLSPSSFSGIGSATLVNEVCVCRGWGVGTKALPIPFPAHLLQGGSNILTQLSLKSVERVPLTSLQLDQALNK